MTVHYHVWVKQNMLRKFCYESFQRRGCLGDVGKHWGWYQSQLQIKEISEVRNVFELFCSSVQWWALELDAEASGFMKQ